MPAGYLKKPPFSAIVQQLAADNKGTCLGLGGLIGLLAYYLVAWTILGRGPAKGTVVVRYEPPRSMSPAVMRYIWKMGYDDRCFTAALLDMSSKGHLKIREDQYQQYVVTKMNGSAPLSEDEMKIMEQLLPGCGEIMLETDDRRLPAAVSVFAEYLRSHYEKISFIGNVRYFSVGLILSAVVVVVSGLGAVSDPLDAALATIRIPPLILFVPEFLKHWKAAAAHGGAKGLRIIKAVLFTIGALFAFGYFFQPLSMMMQMAGPYFIVLLATAVLINSVFYQLRHGREGSFTTR